MELITITGRNNIIAEKEELIPTLFPRGKDSTRPFKFKKPTVFLSARVHPGESPASHMLNGIIKFIT